MALEIVGMLLAGAGASYGWWKLQQRRDSRFGGNRMFEAALDEDAAVVLSVAKHEAVTRQHPYVWPIHLLYGLIQDEQFVAAIEKLGGTASTIEDRVLAELDKLGARDENIETRDEGGRVLAYVYASAHQHGRKITSVDLWAYLARTDTAKLVETGELTRAETAKLVETAKPVDTRRETAKPVETRSDTAKPVESGELTRDALTFVLVHKMAEPSTDLPDRTDVHVVLRNDDYTPRDFVVWILREIFELPADEAETRMLQTHNEGRAIVGRYKLAAVRDKIDQVRARAREQHFPLWIGVEDC